MIDNYKDLTLEKYIQLREIDTTELEPIDIQVQMLSILSDLPEDEVLEKSLTDYNLMVAKMDFLTVEPSPIKNIPSTLTIGKNKYKVLKDAREMTAGQFIDYQAYIKDADDKKLPLLLTCFIIPQGHKYGEGYEIETVMADINKLPIETVLGLAAFFLRQSQKLIDSTLVCLDWTIRRMEKKEKRTEIKEKLTEARKKLRSLRDLVNDGDGLVW